MSISPEPSFGKIPFASVHVVAPFVMQMQGAVAKLCKINLIYYEFFMFTSYHSECKVHMLCKNCWDYKELDKCMGWACYRCQKKSDKKMEEE